MLGDFIVQRRADVSGKDVECQGKDFQVGGTVLLMRGRRWQTAMHAILQDAMASYAVLRLSALTVHEAVL